MQIEQGRLTPVEVGIAGTIGRTAATVKFGLGRMREGVLFGLNALNPLATTNFTISNHFKFQARDQQELEGLAKANDEVLEQLPKLDYEKLEQAVRNSDLPEGIYIALPQEKDPPKPFVTVTSRPTGDEAVQELFDKGAAGYLVLTYDPKTKEPLLRKPA